MIRDFNRSHLRTIGLVCLLMAPAAFTTGCGKEAAKGERLTPVVGKVTLNGKPLGAGAVTFHPDTSKGNNSPHIPVGMLDASGEYKLMSATKDGAPLGWYKITVSAQEPIDLNNPYAPPKNIINPKFGDVQTSGLSLQVVENPAPGAYDIKVTK